MQSTPNAQGIALHQAALIAGLGILVMAFAAPFAEFAVYGRLVSLGDIEGSVRNIGANQGLVLAGIIAYLVTFVCDVIVAWALYVLLAPVNRPLALLTAWFRLVYTTIAFLAFFNLVTVFRIVEGPDFLTAFGSDQLHAQVSILLRSFRYGWGMGMILFGIHLGFLGYLVYRSGYIPRFLGVLLGVAGVGYLIYELKPLLYPLANVEFIMITFVGELIFMLWLLIRGWRMPAPAVTDRTRVA